MMNTHNIGDKYEQIAAEYLEKCGYNIICRNYRCKLGEIDIIAKDGSYLVFIEVKFRKNLNMGSPFDAVDYRKQVKIRKTCEWYLMENNISDSPIRFDVIGITGSSIELYKAAF